MLRGYKGFSGRGVADLTWARRCFDLRQMVFDLSRAKSGDLAESLACALASYFQN